MQESVELLFKHVQCTRKAPEEASRFNVVGSETVPKPVVPSQGRFDFQFDHVQLDPEFLLARWDGTCGVILQ
ncbi:tRNA wybutosine-synthesizing protein 3 [Fusarium oxysporum f. sp. albedinis]|nr:tRNA wybutosine-synthesizing protein 3 [Fusarium oxysporum f. sp. albedinis]